MKKKLLKWLGIEVVDLDAFSSGQVGSKIWLADRLEGALRDITAPVSGYKIWIYGGWYGLANFIIRVRGQIPIEFVRSIDQDPDCEPVADRINKFWEWQGWQFKAQTGNANTVQFIRDNPHIVINTSIEHMEQHTWFNNIPDGTICVLQVCDLPHKDHVAVIKDLDEFKRQFPLKEVLYEGKMTFNYPTGDMSRLMIIGLKGSASHCGFLATGPAVLHAQT
jgi:hypothetical protein